LHDASSHVARGQDFSLGVSHEAAEPDCFPPTRTLESRATSLDPFSSRPGRLMGKSRGVVQFAVV